MNLASQDGTALAMSATSARPVVRSSLRSTTHSPTNRLLAQELAWCWVGTKWPGLAPSPCDREKAHLHRSLPGRRLSVSTSGDGSVWTLEVAHTEREGARTWVTRAQVMDTGAADAVGLQTSCSDLPSVPLSIAPPRLLGAWVERLSLEDGGIAVMGEARIVDSQEQLAAFCAHVLSDKRNLPIIALANRTHSRYYGVDPRGLAEAVRGLAHVACLAPELVADAGHRLGRNLGPVPAAARIYAPNFTAADGPKDHPLIRVPTAASAHGTSDQGAFRRLLSRRVCAMSVDLTASSEVVPTTWRQ